MKGIFSSSHQDEECPVVCMHALAQPTVNAIWMRGNKLYHALKVMTLDANIRTFLEKNDPMALKQAEKAIHFADN